MNSNAYPTDHTATAAIKAIKDQAPATFRRRQA